MSSLLMLLGFTIGIILGNFPSVLRPRPAWWRWAVVILTSLTIVLALWPPLGGTFNSVVLMGRSYEKQAVPLKARIDHSTKSYNAERDEFSVVMRDFSSEPREFPVVFTGREPAEISSAKVVIVNVRLGDSDTDFRGESVVAVDPSVTIGFVPALAERIRNVYFHVPMAWIGFLAYFLTMMYSVRYLRKRQPSDDIKAAAAAGLGTAFTVLATITGMVWAKFNWGAFWSWDPRQTSIFVLLMIYGAYFALRGALSDDDDKRARLSAVYSIFGFVSAIFLVYIIPRIMEGLHPGAAKSGDMGPLVDGSIDPIVLSLYTLSLMSFTLIYFWLYSITVRSRFVAMELDEAQFS